MAENGDEASDAVVPGPGTSAADLSAAGRRANDDEPGTLRDYDLVERMELPLSGEIKCKKCTNNDRRFLRDVDWAKHMGEQHPEYKIMWRCAECGKDFEKIHGCKCHLPKCKGRQEQVESGISCIACGSVFKTKRGLSQHERHRHPNLRNAKRVEAANPPARPNNRASVWTEAEVQLLIQLNERYKEERYPNVRIREFIPNKTLKQISDKRRLLPARVVEADAVEELDTSSSSRYSTASEGEVEGPLGEQEDGSWKDLLRVAIMANPPEEDGPMSHIERGIVELANKDRLDPQDTERILEQIVTLLKEGIAENEPPMGRRSGGGRKRNTNRTESDRARRCKFTYSRYQELYNKCPQKLIDMAFAGEKVIAREKVVLPCKNDIKSLYDGLWGKDGPITGIPKLGRGPSDLSPMDEVWKPITLAEVIEKVKKIKADTAPGVDGIKKAHLKKKGALSLLTKFFNLIMLQMSYPEQWKTNRTTLIPKPGKNTNDAKNWRPITIGSLLGRIYSSMLDNRLRGKIRNSKRQKGFTREDGCKQNIAILDNAINTMKSESGGVIIVIDIAKAFDTVPHKAIGDGLRAKGIPAEVAEYVQNMYDGCKTKIKTEKDTISIQLKRGVKQGDPLSPLLFNVIVDPIIDEIDETTEGIKMGDDEVSILASADDLVLMAKDKRTAAEILKKLNKYLEELGMGIQRDKCASFQIARKNKTWHILDPKIELNDGEVPYTEPEDVVAYLGVTLDPRKGLQRSQIKRIVDAAENISKMGLKPHQKINLIRSRLLPKYIHRLVANPPPICLLNTLDHEIKQVVKKILHLHPSTTDGIIYVEKRNGGLGMQRVADIVRIAKLRNSLRMMSNEDIAVQEAYKRQEDVIRNYATSVRIRWPATMEEIECARADLKRGHLEKWKQLVSQGQGIESFENDKTGNAWLYTPKLLKPSRYLDALRLRTNTFGTRVALHRANKEVDVMCRRCKAQVETLGHILGNCLHTKPSRIRRHDEIVSMIEEKVSRRCAVFKEAAVNIMGELRKPDLVFKDQERLIVVDVTVRYEDKESLRKAHKEKQNKYRETAEHIRRRLGCDKAEVIPIVVGCRGALPAATVKGLKALGLGKGEMLTASMIALRSSIEMANAFIDYSHMR